MSLLQSVESYIVIKLADAMLCLDCSVIYTLRAHRRCPACASEKTATVSGFLNRKEDR